jgi:hypothetical protein
VADVIAGHILAKFDEIIPLTVKDRGIVADHLAEDLAARFDKDLI